MDQTTFTNNMLLRFIQHNWFFPLQGEEIQGTVLGQEVQTGFDVRDQS